VRSRLGESIPSIERSDVPAVQLTTSSWEALHHFGTGQAAWLRGDYREAGALFELALEEDPEFATARRSLGLALIQFLGEPERGKEELQRALADSEYLPRRERLLIRASNLEFVDRDFEGALETYTMLQQLYPDSATPYNNAGMILRQLGRYDEAVEMFERALEVEPFLTPPLYNLYYSHIFERFDPVAAEAAARRLVESAPGVDHTHNALAWSLIAQGRLEDALQPLHRTLEISSRHPYALPNLAHVLLALDRPDEAVPLYREVRDLVEADAIPGSLAKTTFDLAFATAAAGDPDRAAAIAKEGGQEVRAKLGGQPAGARELLLLGQLDVMAGDRQSARSRLRRAAGLDIEDPGDLIYLAELYALLGDRDRAIETLANALDAGYQDRFFPRVMPAFESIRDDPRFEALMAPPEGVGS
jgi:tetratricopeptide (TPR) repeat protein